MELILCQALPPRSIKPNQPDTDGDHISPLTLSCDPAFDFFLCRLTNMWFANGRTGSLTGMKKGFMAFHFNWVKSTTSTHFSFSGTELTLHHWATNDNNSSVVTGLNVNMTTWEEIKKRRTDVKATVCTGRGKPPLVRNSATATDAEKPCCCNFHVYSWTKV